MVKETTLTVEKKPILLAFPHIGSTSLQSRIKLKKSLKNVLSCCKLQILFKNKTRLGNTFHFKDRFLKDVTPGAVYKFQCGLCSAFYYGQVMRYFNERVLVYNHLPKSKLSLKKAP